MSKPDRELVRDAALVGFGWMVAAAAIGSGVGGLYAGLFLASLPVVSFVAFGHVPGRGAAVACIAMSLWTGATGVVFPGAGSFSAIASLGILSTAAVGAQRLSILSAQGSGESPKAAAEAKGRWVHIYVEADGPANASVAVKTPVRSPGGRSERRALTRLIQRRSARLLTIVER